MNSKETKQCLACGEEILATAKKCKHCGEWLDNDAPMKKQEIVITKKNSLNYKLLAILCYIAMCFVVISCLQDIFDGTEVRGHGKARALIMIAQFIPEWLTVICEGSIMVFLIIALRKQYMFSRSDKPIPFMSLIILTIVSYFFSLVVTFEFADENIFYVFLFIGLLALAGMSVLEFIVGFHLRERLKEASMVGMAMMILAVATILMLLVGFGIGFDETPIWIMIILSGTSIFFLYTLKEFFSKKETENPSEILEVQLQDKLIDPTLKSEPTIESEPLQKVYSTSKKNKKIQKYSVYIIVGLCLLGITIKTVSIIRHSSNSYSHTKTEQQEFVENYANASRTTDPKEQFEIGEDYYYNDENYTEALKWYRKSAEQGYAPAQYELGYMYYEGKSIKQDYTEAFKWFRKSADQGNAKAQKTLGTMYFLGEGVAKNSSEAVNWYRKSAEQGYKYAQYDLGRMYEYGNGITQDYSMAIEWYQKAAKQGHEKASEALKHLLESEE